MRSGLSLAAGRGRIGWTAVFVASMLLASPGRAAVHLWNLNEIYTNNTGSLQFIELFTPFDGQPLLNGQQIQVTNVGGTLTNTFTLTADAPGSTLNHHLLLATAGAQAAGGPTPDFILPNNFLFAGGGTISFFGANSGSYSALPTDGILSRTWGGGNATNSPTNFGGQSGVIGVPEPTSMLLVPAAVGLFAAYRRRTRPELSSESVA